MIRWFRRLHSAALASTLFRNTAALVSGTAFAQAVLFVFSPLLSRIFDVAEFGDLANYNAWVALLALLSSLRYEHAILVARTRQGLNRALALTLSLSITSVLAYAVVALAIAWVPTSNGYVERLRSIVGFIPLGVLVVCVTSVLMQLNVRLGRFKRLAAMGAVQVLLTVGPQIALGLADVPNALVIGTIVGYLCTAVPFAWMFIREHDISEVRRARGLRRLAITAREHANFPRYTLAADALSIAVQQFIPVFILGLFSPAAAGLYSFAIRVVRVPLLVIATAVTGALRKEAIDRVHAGRSLTALFMATLRSLFVIALVPFAAVLVFGREIFAIVFGAQWGLAGEMIQILSPGILFEFIAVPLGAFFLVTGMQRYAFAVQLSGFCMMVAALVAGKYFLGDFLATCYLVSGVMIVANVLGIALAARVAGVAGSRAAAAPGAALT